MRTHTHTHTHTHTYSHARTHTHTHSHAHARTHTHIHTHMHAHTQADADEEVPDELAGLVVHKSADPDLSSTSEDYPESLDSSTGEELSRLKQVSMFTRATEHPVE